MRVTIKAGKLSEMDPETGQLYRAEKGDVFTVSDTFGRHLCDRGWADDADGQYTSAPFTPGAVRVTPQNVNVAGG